MEDQLHGLSLSERKAKKSGKSKSRSKSKSSKTKNESPISSPHEQRRKPKTRDCKEEAVVEEKTPYQALVKKEDTSIPRNKHIFWSGKLVYQNYEFSFFNVKFKRQKAATGGWLFTAYSSDLPPIAVMPEDELVVRFYLERCFGSGKELFAECWFEGKSIRQLGKDDGGFVTVSDLDSDWHFLRQKGPTIGSSSFILYFVSVRFISQSVEERLPHIITYVDRKVSLK
mmetsp:Transcript_27792/g.69657  ORF Transcript_27792/g.69657 Transcript_27792/m.69657 type:complete len:227 (+) Transcript_27792:276-956(+)|eukprot:CAMPEP_0177632856 /NCGR_PEP_ID=MMETSP0447-20121125/2527_1 /TAXON_ID=0 /ORGANISM="Stygamoeba regulata, Strain BSH-02190019" /LENGTH=226 /DNA_ID=CAMNT_0019134477 /DNA_START=197 /DNA_END=877 /DNA_ORIENTATION=+